MLDLLLGNKNASRILLFLFVNRTSYGLEIKRSLNIPLTPIQNAFQRLEKAGILISDAQGNMRIYRLNPAFALLEELEAMLRKAFILLPPEEKKRYFPLEFNKMKRYGENVLFAFWEKLSDVKRLICHVKKSNTPFAKRGKAQVIIERKAHDLLLFHEKGTWEGDEMMNFSNVYRWRLDREIHAISLEHLRYSENRPVLLFYLRPQTQSCLSAIDPYLCSKDIYFGKLTSNESTLILSWRIIGPCKNEEIEYYYF